MPHCKITISKRSNNECVPAQEQLQEPGAFAPVLYGRVRKINVLPAADRHKTGGPSMHRFTGVNVRPLPGASFSVIDTTAICGTSENSVPFGAYAAVSADAWNPVFSQAGSVSSICKNTSPSTDHSRSKGTAVPSANKSRSPWISIFFSRPRTVTYAPPLFLSSGL